MARETNTTQYIVIALGLIIFYFLSPPLVVALLGKAQVTAHQQFLEAIYWPAERIYEHFSPYAAYIDWLMNNR